MIRLRPTRDADLDRLFELDQICFPPGVAYSRGEFRSLLGSPRTLGLVAEAEGSLAGFVLAQASRARRTTGGHIVTIDTAPEFRRRGIGKMLMEQIESKMGEAGAEWMRLEVAVDNTAALAFYEGLGFEVLGRIPGYYHQNLDALVMEKCLQVRAVANGQAGDSQ
ncbi:Ribosomal-protein-S18p-alanine acetyltransferase [Acidisarcina polymorpha]|uniref:Ribosomal-protein-S18p-alanine acetyltransferase n=1 Tax=Acidisarcina polymorpha TaxID=2211140 RepID=A0A2Z5FS61_9BACT|nr:N-acetyltransferase [Acidisarcina polymorpha]AXC09608.1 Ribosomal-protein-S18p-alanine acetyltransferase [Acidisarcina polymorpha]